MGSELTTHGRTHGLTTLDVIQNAIELFRGSNHPREGGNRLGRREAHGVSAGESSAACLSHR
jgi:hypothetical protein